jgi:hypothetical protein
VSTSEQASKGKYVVLLMFAHMPCLLGNGINNVLKLEQLRNVTAHSGVLLSRFALVDGHATYTSDMTTNDDVEEHARLEFDRLCLRLSHSWYSYLSVCTWAQDKRPANLDMAQPLCQ